MTSPASTSVLLQAATELTATRAWVLYTDRQSSFVTEHPVDQVDGRPHIGAGRPATVDGVRDALAALDGRERQPAYLPDSVLCCAEHLTVWWRPPCKKRVVVLDRDSTSQRAVEVLLPTLVYAVGVCVPFSVYAVKGN